MPITDLIVIRHGETDWNRQLRFQGHIDVPLNGTGREQAQRMAAALAGERVHAMACSDLLRTRETASPLEAVLGQRAALLPGLREQNFGVLEGLDATEAHARHPPLWTSWQRHEAEFALPDGESTVAFHARVWAAMSELARQHAGQTVAVVTHGGVLDMLWRSAHGLPLHGPRACDIPNTGINRLRWADGRLSIVRWADAAHLQGLPAQPATAPPVLA